MSPSPPRNITLQGVAVSPGIAIGKAYFVERKKVDVPRFCILDDSQIPNEIKRFMRAIKDSQDELKEIKGRIKDSLLEEHIPILDAHIRMLQDKTLREHTTETIRRERINAEWALSKTLQRFRDLLMAAEDEYLRSRVSDIDFVGQRILRHLKGVVQERLDQIQEEVVVVAHDLSPADTALINNEFIKGFVTDMGGRTSHTAIIARSLEIPTVVGLERVTEVVRTGDTVVVDGVRGLVLVDPDPEVLEEYSARRTRYLVVSEALMEYGQLPGETKDGFTVTVGANIEWPGEVTSVLNHGGEAVGLYRTEFLYLNRPEFPTEEEHYRTYKEVVERMSPRPVTIRTLDIGGDRLLGDDQKAKETNPALGLRAIRLSLKQREVFKTQLMGILRASAHGTVRIMFPMISGISELRAAKEILHEAMDELRKRGEEFDPNVEVGAMIEIPSAVSIADFLAQEVNFFSIGTNDLIQYTLAIDRVNEQVVYLYEPLHPAVLRMIKTVVDAGHGAGIPVGMCGEMAGEPLYVPILLGMELDELSMNTVAIPLVKKFIRSLNLKDCRKLAEDVMEFRTAEEIKDYVNQTLHGWFPEEIDELALNRQ
jgi:phosphotransferase system enzyme I (PtsI)